MSTRIRTCLRPDCVDRAFNCFGDWRGFKTMRYLSTDSLTSSCGRIGLIRVKRMRLQKYPNWVDVALDKRCSWNSIVYLVYVAFCCQYNLTCIAVVHVVVISDALAIAINVHSLSVIYSNVPVNSEQKPFHKSWRGFLKTIFYTGKLSPYELIHPQTVEIQIIHP